MTSEYGFPTLRLALLNNLLDLKTRIEAEPDALKSRSCPYDPETIDLLEALLAPKIIEKVVTHEAPIEKRGRGAPRKDVTLSEADQDELEDSAKSLLKELKNLGNGEVKLDTAAKVQIVRAKAALIETVLKQVERVYNIKRVSGFEAVVIGILEDCVSDEQRDEFLRRLEPYRTT